MYDVIKQRSSGCIYVCLFGSYIQHNSYEGLIRSTAFKKSKTLLMKSTQHKSVDVGA